MRRSKSLFPVGRGQGPDTPGVHYTLIGACCMDADERSSILLSGFVAADYGHVWASVMD
ncbi:hypothetical protein K2X14_12840 [Acetobacter sp. TBRC 12305]|uniref:Uncharacterized protein n=1 Tax=Acetobacter garciniae TaxID=2817435 RepID=A0A939HMS5_9PROT|nr:hypothetical protein [Acetobacter garciniae]MBO1325830.1 hypothetical protein [Acetobacter garciniae]MBX0345730.1 hypothetical protein [Acetobacter garciniae]